jgi:hypothetical protein
MTPVIIFCHFSHPASRIDYVALLVKLEADRLKAVVLDLAHGK